MHKNQEYPSLETSSNSLKIKKHINCLCGETFSEKELKKHIRNCSIFLYRFEIFDYKICKLLEEYLSDKKNLFLVRFLFKRYLKLLDKKIKKYLKEKEIENLIKISNNKNDMDTSNSETSEEDNLFQQKNKIRKFNIDYLMSNSKNDMDTSNSETSEEDYLLQQKNKLRKFNIDYLISNSNENQINNNQINEIKEKDDINNIDFFDIKENKTIKINKKKKINTPTPEDNSSSKKYFNFFNIFSSHKAIKCQFCSNEIKQNENCPNKKCIELNKILCRKKLPCGHTCLGVYNEIVCPPCLEPKCKKYGGLFNQNKNTYCQICREILSSSPIVNLSCNHYIHYLCLLKKLRKGDNLYGKKLNFDFMKCPVCDSIFECNSIPEIKKKLGEYKQIYLKVRTLINLRLKYEKIYSTQNPFDLFIFFLCYKCHNPYYAGLNSNNNINKIKNNSNLIGNKEDCLCGKDSFVYNAKGQNICQVHKNMYAEYKCKYCCKIASRFWSQTHFCEDCYSQRSYINKEYCEIKKCDIDKCPFNGFHAPNGIEYCLGCFLCRLENRQNEYPIFAES